MLVCRLCLIKTNDFKRLCDENGQDNEIYHITVKYFDPMWLSYKDNIESKVICNKCWYHINEFHCFQETVTKAQSQLTGNSKNVKILIETKNESDFKFKELQDDDGHIEGLTYSKAYKSEVCSQTSEDDGQSNIELQNIIELPRRSKRLKNVADEVPNIKRKYKTSKSIRSTDEQNCKNFQMKHRNKKPISLNNDLTNNAFVSPKEKENSTKTSNVKCQENHLKKTIEYDAFISEWKRDLDCITCNTSFPNFTVLRTHFRQEHPDQKCYVVCCKHKLYDRFQLVEHIRLHIDPNTFKCEVCGKCATNSRNLKKHMREMHSDDKKERQFECDVCSKRFARKAILKAHMDIHATGNKDHLCKVCGKGFVLLSRLRIHERSVHDAIRVCDQCGKKIAGKYALKQHLLEHSGIVKPTWSCDQCDAKLNSHYSLKRHKEIKHNDGSTLYICSECGKCSTSVHALRNHKKNVHQTIRKYKCNICDKAFKIALTLREHMASHTGEDLYKCPHCPKTFKVSSNMHHHRKKFHPLEWAQGRKQRKQRSDVDSTLIANEVVL
uniref:Zinc finger protein 865 n=1 Tax=Glossina brevipalpis TaxID=37001 RepID=A0A1A9W948_9MUSC